METTPQADLEAARDRVRAFIREMFERNEANLVRYSRESHDAWRDGIDERLEDRIDPIRERHLTCNSQVYLFNGCSEPPRHHPDFEVITGATALPNGRIEVETRCEVENAILGGDRTYVLERKADEWRIKTLLELCGDTVDHDENSQPTLSPQFFKLTTPALNGELKIDRYWEQPSLFDLAPLTGGPGDLGCYFRSLQSVARPCIRLHPKATETRLPAICSKFGGTFVDNAVDWPTCDLHNTPFVGALQLARDEFPELFSFSDAEFLQILWCPFEEDHDLRKDLRARWIRTPVPEKTLPENPAPRVPYSPDLIPKESRLLPEVFPDYPAFRNLPAEIQEEIHNSSRIRKLADAIAGNYGNDPKSEMEVVYCDLACVPGSHIGGYPEWWIHDGDEMQCQCGTPMEFLLTIASGEHEGERWNPIEEADSSTKSLGPGLRISRSYALNVFVCKRCPDGPTLGSIG